MLLAALAAVTLLAAVIPAAQASTPRVPMLPVATFSSTPPRAYQAPFPPAGGGIPGGIGTLPIGPESGSGGGTSTNAAGTCSSTSGNDIQGRVGGTTNLTCQGSGLVFVGPSTGQIASVIGPTIIGGAVGNVLVTAGNGSIGAVQ
jgi:hypothetical protein